MSALPGDAESFDRVDGGAGQDRLFIDYSSEDIGTGLDGGYFLGSTNAGFFLRRTRDNLSDLDAVAFTNIERLDVIGTIKDDTIYGGSGDDVLLPGGGNDTIYGGRGSNYISAGDGNDVVIDQSDINRSLGNSLGRPSNSHIVLDGGRGIDTLSINLSGKAFDANFAIRNFSLISINPLQENLNQRISLPDGSTIGGFEIFKDITTGFGDDTVIQLGRVNNTFITGDGNDVMNAGLGIDVVDSTTSDAPDDDLLIVDYSVEDIGTGISTTTNGFGTGRLYRRTLDDRNVLDEVSFSGIERFNVNGTSQNDQIEGSLGSDVLSGNAGDDSLVGNRGNDFLSGGDGDDRLNGVYDVESFVLANFPGIGEVDTLTGGAGADTFVLGSRSKAFYLGQGDTDAAIITDFNPAEGDILELFGSANNYALVFEDTDNIAVNIYYKKPLGGTDLIAVLNGVSDFSLNANYIRYSNNNGLNQVGRLNDSIRANVIAPVVANPDLSLLQAVADLNPQPLPPAAEDLNPQPLALAGTFEIQQNNDTTQLLTALTALGNTTGLSNFEVESTGDGRAFGTFQNDPFGLGAGIVLSTGKVEDLVGQNTSDGGLSPSSSVPLKFTKLPGKAGPVGSLGTGVFVADLSKVGFDIKSLSFADSGSFIGGSPGRFSGFDLDAIKFSHTLINDASQIATLPNLSELNVFDFTPVGTIFTPGTQRSPVDLTRQELFGTVNGLINNGLATLDTFDAFNYIADDRAFGAVSLGDRGKVAFNLTQSVATTGTPLYLYVGEAANNDETPDGQITVSNREVGSLSDLSTDFGTLGAKDDAISLKFSFDADATAQTLYFQFVFGSEELAEYGGSDFNDAFSLELNGFNMAQLSDSAAVTINNLAPRPFAPYNPDLVYNPVETGPASSQTKLDGYTKVLTFAAPLDPNTKNTLEIKVKDGRDGLLDSAVFIKAGTFGTTPPVLGTSLQVKNDNISTDEDTALTVDPAMLLLNDIAANSGDTLSVTSVDGTGTAGTVNFDGSLITYDPAQKFESLAVGETATDQFGYTVSDGNGGTSSGSVVVAIAGVNDAPVAVDDTIATTCNAPITITAATLLSNDSDVDGSDTLSITNVNTAINGTVSIDSNGDIIFTPYSIFTGQGSFKYTASDGNGGTATALVNIITPSDIITRDIDGTPGNDVLVGTAANDSITGFQGADTLTGSGGKNLFIHTTVYDQDVASLSSSVVAPASLSSNIPLQPLDDQIFDPNETIMPTIVIADDEVGGLGEGGQRNFILRQEQQPTTIDFQGIGRGINPAQAVINKVNTIQFEGADLVAKTLLLTQVGNDLTVSFDGVQNTQAILKDFALENLENLSKLMGGTGDLSNILFDGQITFQDSFDVFNADDVRTALFNRKTVTFLNDLDNSIYGFEQSDNVINGQGSNGKIYSLSGNDILLGGAGNDKLFAGVRPNIVNGGLGDNRLYLGRDRDVDRAGHRSGDGSDVVEQFMLGAGSDRFQFEGIAAIDVVSNGSSTSFRLSDSIVNNAGFGSGQLLMELGNNTGFTRNTMGLNLASGNTVQLLFA